MLKNYVETTPELIEKLIRRVNKGDGIGFSAKMLGISYERAKVILDDNGIKLRHNTEFNHPKIYEPNRVVK